MNHHGHYHVESEGSTGAGVDLRKRLFKALLITFSIFIVEIAGGFLSNSLALKSDAGHLFGDVMALGLSLLAVRLSALPASRKRTFGYHRTEVLAAMINGLTLLFLAGYIFYESYNRLLKPEPIKSAMMLAVAVIGLAANTVVILSLRGYASENLNVRAAFLHVIGDMLGSVGVVLGGLIMFLTGNYLADPIISFFVGAIILLGALSVLREGVNILLEGMPRTIKYDDLKADMESIEGVVAVHDLHVWTISSSNVVLSAHVEIPDQPTHASRKILNAVKGFLKKKYGISHATLQIECECCVRADRDCSVF
jgi:cobalt-zinc-cadmium efflux system protein